MSNCAYCYQPSCRCSYRAGQLGRISRTIQNTSADSTAGLMLQEIVEHFSQLPLDMRGAWSVSFTQYDEDKLDRNIRRHANALRLSDQIGQ